MSARPGWRACAAAAAAAVWLAACGGGQDERAAAAEPPAAEAAAAAEAAPAAAADSPEHPRLAVGAAYSTDAFMVTVRGAAAVAGYDYFDRAENAAATRRADPGEVFLIVDIEFESLGGWSLGTNGNQLALRGQFTVSDGAGNDYSYAPYFGEKALVLAPQLDKGEKLRGEILYVVPEDAQGLTIRYQGRKFPRPTLAEWPLPSGGE